MITHQDVVDLRRTLDAADEWSREEWALEMMRLVPPLLDSYNAVNNAINWHTSCGGCAKQLDDLYELDSLRAAARALGALCDEADRYQRERGFSRDKPGQVRSDDIRRALKRGP
jgi:hypothetical protein